MYHFTPISSSISFSLEHILRIMQKFIIFAPTLTLKYL